MEQKKLNEAFSSLTNFESDQEYELALNFIAENSVFMRYSYDEIYQIKNMGGNVKPSFLLDVVKINNFEMLQSLSEYKVDWNFKENNQNALDVAVSLGADEKSIDFLASRGLKLSN